MPAPVTSRQPSQSDDHPPPTHRGWSAEVGGSEEKRRWEALSHVRCRRPPPLPERTLYFSIHPDLHPPISRLSLTPLKTPVPRWPHLVLQVLRLKVCGITWNVEILQSYIAQRWRWSFSVFITLSSRLDNMHIILIVDFIWYEFIEFIQLKKKLNWKIRYNFFFNF